MRKPQLPQSCATVSLAAFLALLSLVSSSRGTNLNDPNFNPLKGGHITIVSRGDTLRFDCTSGTCVPNAGDTLKILGSTSGLAHDGTNGIKVWIYRNDTTFFDGGASEGFTIGGNPEFWMNGICGGDGKPTCTADYLEFVNSRNEVVAGDQDVTAITVPYLQKTIGSPPSYPITILPTFGMSGEIRCSIKVGHKTGAGCTACPTDPNNPGHCIQSTYREIVQAGLIGRSTDVDGDGDTDEADVDSVRASISPGPPKANHDLDWSASSTTAAVTTADLDIVLAEARRRNGGAPWTGGTLGDDGADGDAINAYNTSRLVMTAPATISSLSVSRLNASTVRLSWTAPADDGSTGSPATAYAVRSQTSPITNVSQFDAATVVSSPPTPGAAGSGETMDVSLSEGTCAYFSIRAKDDVDNWSAVGNSPSELSAPAAVSDLLAPTGRYMAKLTWTAPGDDGYCGTATDYSVRYIVGGTISEGNWASATVVSSPPTPAAAGTEQCMVVADLSSCTSYSFALKTRDAAGQWSAISNVKTVTTKCSGNPTVDCGGFAMSPATDEDHQWALELGRFQPNPTRSAGHLTFVIPAAQAGAELDLSVFDVTGRRVATLRQGAAVAGPHRESWDLRATSGQRVGAGVYFLRLRLGEAQLSQVIQVAP